MDSSYLFIPVITTLVVFIGLPIVIVHALHDHHKIEIEPPLS